MSVIETDGQLDMLEELIYVEEYINQVLREITQQILRHALSRQQWPTGPFHTILGLKIRKLYEEIRRNEAKVNSYTIFLLKQKKTYSKQQLLDHPPVTDPLTYFH